MTVSSPALSKSSSSTGSKQSRFLGIDSLRMVAAFWVMMDHGALFPLTEGYDATQRLPKLFNGLWTGCISGPAAVILFFVISGFCIHSPQSEGRPFRLGQFWVMRAVRIILPMVMALAFARAVLGWNFSPDPLAGIPAWSLVCEIVYYLLYPALLHLHKRFDFRLQLVVAFVLALVLASTKPIANCNYPAWGYSLDWLLGLPCWLLGVVLAGQHRQQPPSIKVIWRYRIAAAGIGAVTHHLALQKIIGQHLTLNFFALYCFLWLKKELDFYGGDRRPWRFLEWGGKWSYSLYLVHGPAFALLMQLQLPMFGHMANWVIKIVWVLGLSWVFYLLVERPSHRLARSLGGLLFNKKPVKDHQVWNPCESEVPGSGQIQ